MEIPKVNFIFRMLDVLLFPFMYVFGGFKFPIQETHMWHVKRWDWKDTDGLVIKEFDKKAKFGHTSSFGLFHMPLFGGLTKYVVIEASGFNKYWNVGWEEGINLLRIKENRIMLLTGKNGFIAYGLGDGNKNLKLKIVGYGILGDNKYKGIRLF